MSTGYPLLDEVNRLRGVVAAQAAEIERLREWNRQMIEQPASDGILNTYREMGVKLAVAEAAKDRAWALYNHQSEARVAVTAERDEALARATAAEDEAARLREVAEWFVRYAEGAPVHRGEADEMLAKARAALTERKP